jgi:hypothetical protein
MHLPISNSMTLSINTSIRKLKSDYFMGFKIDCIITSSVCAVYELLNQDVVI